MWNKLKNIFRRQPPRMEISSIPSIHKLVSLNSLNKRKNARVQYPHFGAGGPYPKVIYNNREMTVGNISLGGLLVIDDTDFLKSKIGETTEIDLIWADFQIKARVRTVGSHLQRRHLQFVESNPEVIERISRLSKPAYTGSKFHRVPDEASRINAKELWIGALSESLIIKETDVFAEYHINKQTYLFQRGYPILDKTTGAPVAHNLAEDILVTFANIPKPTTYVRQLCEIIETEIRSSRPKKTGTYG